RQSRGRRPELVFHRDRKLATTLPATNPLTHGVDRELEVGPTYAQYEGNYSWLVTISPTLYELFSPAELQGFLGGPGITPANSAATAKQFLVSVVVFFGRDVGRLDRSELSLTVRD